MSAEEAQMSKSARNRVNKKAREAEAETAEPPAPEQKAAPKPKAKGKAEAKAKPKAPPKEEPAPLPEDKPKPKAGAKPKAASSKGATMQMIKEKTNVSNINAQGGVCTGSADPPKRFARLVSPTNAVPDAVEMLSSRTTCTPRTPCTPKPPWNGNLFDPATSNAKCPQSKKYYFSVAPRLLNNKTDGDLDAGREELVPPTTPPSKIAETLEESPEEKKAKGKGKGTPPIFPIPFLELGEGKAKGEGTRVIPPNTQHVHWQALPKDRFKGILFEELPWDPMQARRTIPGKIEMLTASTAKTDLFVLKSCPLAAKLIMALHELHLDADIDRYVFEILYAAIPTADESKLLLGNIGRLSEQRDAEQFVLPLAHLFNPAVSKRLQFLLFSKTFLELVSDTSRGLLALQFVLQKIHEICAIPTVLRHAQSLGNLLSLGSEHFSVDAIVGFRLDVLDRLVVLTSTRDARISLPLGPMQAPDVITTMLATGCMKPAWKTKPRKIEMLTASRAPTGFLVLKSCPLEAKLMSVLQELQLDADIDQHVFEIPSTAIPIPDESKLLLGNSGRMSEQRDAEQFVLQQARLCNPALSKPLHFLLSSQICLDLVSDTSRGLSALEFVVRRIHEICAIVLESTRDARISLPWDPMQAPNGITTMLATGCMKPAWKTKPQKLERFTASGAATGHLVLKSCPFAAKLMSGLQKLHLDADIDQYVLEMLSCAIPTPDESKGLSGNSGRLPEQRDAEQFVLLLGRLCNPPVSKRLQFLLSSKTSFDLVSDTSRGLSALEFVVQSHEICAIVLKATRDARISLPWDPMQAPDAITTMLATSCMKEMLIASRAPTGLLVLKSRPLAGKLRMVFQELRLHTDIAQNFFEMLFSAVPTPDESKFLLGNSRRCLAEFASPQVSVLEESLEGTGSIAVQTLFRFGEDLRDTINLSPMEKEFLKLLFDFLPATSDINLRRCSSMLALFYSR